VTLEEQLKSRIKIATNLQAEIASLCTEVQGLRHQMDSFAVEQTLFRNSLSALHQEVRMTLKEMER
jgi:hypothetical protein